jgi:hypothetical protein
MGNTMEEKYVYTVIEYDDENDTQGLILNFGKHLESKQGEIYQRMVNAKNKSLLNLENFTSKISLCLDSINKIISEFYYFILYYSE